MLEEISIIRIVRLDWNQSSDGDVAGFVLEANERIFHALDVFRRYVVECGGSMPDSGSLPGQSSSSHASRIHCRIEDQGQNRPRN